jgi:hypothetical protein
MTARGISQAEPKMKEEDNVQSPLDSSKVGLEPKLTFL